MSRTIIKNTDSLSVRIRQRGREELSVGRFREDMNVRVENSSSSSKSILITPGGVQKHSFRIIFNSVMADIILKDDRVLLDMSRNLFAQGSRG